MANIDKNSRNSLVALGFLVMAIAFVGAYVVFEGDIISADTATVSQDTVSQKATETSASTWPLKLGVNYLTMGAINLTPSDKIVQMNDGMYSLGELQDLGIVGRVALVDGSSYVEIDPKTTTIIAGAAFSLEVFDISSSPVLVLGSSE